jgi:hypothetical protein
MTMPWAGGTKVSRPASNWNSPSVDNPPSGIKVWHQTDGWVLRPVRVWSGVEWAVCPLKYWDGTAWVEAGW